MSGDGGQGGVAVSRRQGGGRVLGGRAVGLQPDGVRMVTDHERDERQHQQGRAGDDQRGHAPSVAGRQPGHGRQEDQLPGGAGGGEDAAHEAAAGDEPAGHQGRDEGHRDRARTQADDHAPEQPELPRLGHEDGEPAAGREQQQRHGQHRPDPEAVHERRGEGGEEPEEHEVDRDRHPDRAVRPAELRVQRVDEHARDGAEAGSTDDRDEAGERDPPGAVHPRCAGARGPGHGGGGMRHTSMVRHDGVPTRVAGMPICVNSRP